MKKTKGRDHKVLQEFLRIVEYLDRQIPVFPSDRTTLLRAQPGMFNEAM